MEAYKNLQVGTSMTNQSSVPSFFIKALKAFLHLGIREHYHDNLKKRIKITNWIILLSALGTLGWAANAGFTPFASMIVVVSLSAYALMIVLLLKGQHVLARMIHVPVSLFSVSSEIIFEGYKHSGEYFALLPALAPFLLFGQEEKKYRSIVLYPALILIYIPALVAVMQYPGLSDMLMYEPILQTQLSRLLNFTITAGCMTFAVHFLVNENHKAEMRTLEGYKTIKEKNRRIEVITNSLQSILNHIPQGILSIGPGGLIGSDHSVHLLHLLENRDIAGKNIKHAFLDRCTLSPDARDQIYQSLLAALGESEISFEMNAANFPSQITYLVGDRKKFFKATWSPRLEEGEVQNILLTLLDVTAEKELERASHRYQEDMKKVQEVLTHSPEKMAQFFSTSSPLLLENEQIFLAMPPEHDADAIRLMFVNAHTIKGAARTLGMKALAEALHTLESYYVELLHSGGKIDKERMTREYQEAVQVFEDYRRINRDKLNREIDFSNIMLERHFMESHYYLIDRLIKDKNMAGTAIVGSFRDQSRALTRMIFTSLQESFLNYKEKSVKIAKDLGKEAPHFICSIPDVYLRPQQVVAFDNIMVHILRNALDHGIESGEERVRKAKPKAGSIRINGSMEAHVLKLCVEDDGRGLDIRGLREIGLLKGLLGKNSSLEDVAKTIFIPGISSARILSHISGRGMGMNAVRTFLEKEEGRIDIEILDSKADAGGFMPFRLHIKVPLCETLANTGTP